MPNNYPSPQDLMQQTELLQRMKNAGFAGQPAPIAGGQAMPPSAPPLAAMQQQMPQQQPNPFPPGGQLPQQTNPQMQQQMQLRQIAAGAPGTGFKSSPAPSGISLEAVLKQPSNPFSTSAEQDADNATRIGLRPQYASKYRNVDGSISFPVGQGDMSLTGGLGRMVGRGQPRSLDRNIGVEYSQGFAKGGQVQKFADGGAATDNSYILRDNTPAPGTEVQAPLINYYNKPVLPYVPVAKNRVDYTAPLYNYLNLMQKKYNPLLNTAPTTGATQNPYTLYPGTGNVNDGTNVPTVTTVPAPTTTTIQPNTQTASDSIIKSIFQSALGRDPTSAELSTYGKIYNSTGDALAIKNQILNLPEAIDYTNAGKFGLTVDKYKEYLSELQKDYKNLFGRDYNPATDSYWMDQLATGKETKDKLLTDLASGAQGADKTFISKSSDATKTNTTNQPFDATKYNLTPVDINSPAYKEQTQIGDIYRSVLGHAPDAEGLKYWQGQLESGAVKPEDLQKSIIGGAQGADVQAAQNYLQSQQDQPYNTPTTGARTWETQVNPDTGKTTYTAVQNAPAVTDALKQAVALGIPGFDVYKKGGAVHMADGGYMGMPRPQSDIGGMDQINNLMSQQNEVASFAKGGKMSPLKALAARDYQKETPGIAKLRGEFERRGLDFDGFINNRAVMDQVLTHARLMGQGNDTILAHITPQEAELLKKKGGSGAINPATGLPMFDDGDGGNDNGNGSVGGRDSNNADATGQTGGNAGSAPGGRDSNNADATGTVGSAATVDSTPAFDMSTPMDFSVDLSTPSAPASNPVGKALDAVMDAYNARMDQVNPTSVAKTANDPGLLGGVTNLGAEKTAAQSVSVSPDAMQSAMNALAEGLNAQNATNPNAATSNVGFGKSDKDTSLAGGATKSDTTNSANTSSPATQDSSTTKAADLSNDIATPTESTSNTGVDPTLYGVNNNTQGDTKVAGVTTPGTPATSTPDTKPAGMAGAYDVALNDLIASFGKDKAMSMVANNPLSQVKLAKGGKAKAKSPLAMMQRKSKKA